MILPDVSDKSNDIPRPWNWYQFLPFSLLVHAASLYMGWLFVPSIEPGLVPEPEFRLSVPVQAVVLVDETSGDAPREIFESVDEAFDPFEEEVVEIPPLNLHPVKKTSTENAPSSMPDTSEPVRETSENVTAVRSGLSDGNENRITPENGEYHGQNGNDESRMNTGEEKKMARHDDSSGGGEGASSLKKTEPDMAQVWALYTAQLSAHFKRFQGYPEMARRMKLKGTVVISIELRRDGTVLSAEVAESSGVAMLDDAALQAAKKASPTPPFPKETTENTRKIRIPYRFK